MAQKVISRREWGANYPNGFRTRPMPIREYWLHHSVTIAPNLLPPFDDDDAAVRTLERIGQSRFGGGISYTYPVTPVGRIYEGHSLERQGAHTKGHNTVGAAFCLVGNYDVMAPTAAQELAIATRMVEDHRAGDSLTHQLNGGHRDTFATSCPGNRAYPRIPAINALARDLWAGKIPSPEDDMPDIKDIEAAAQRGVLSGKLGKSQVTVAVALQRIYNALTDPEAQKARDAALAAAVADAVVAKGDTLNDAEIDDIVTRLGQELAEGFDVEITPKPTEVQA